MSERMAMAVEAMGHWVLGWTLVVLAVAVWIRLARPRQAAVRYGGWLLATFAGAALGPAVLAVGPLASWREVLRAFRSPTPVDAPAESTAAFRSWFDGELSGLLARSVAGRDEAPAVPGGVGAPSGPLRSEASPVVVSDRPTPSDRWLFLAAGLWAAGSLLFAARLGWAARRVRSLLAGIDPTVSAGLEAEMETSRRDLGIRRRLRIAVHPEIAAPMCVGLLRPIILWPTAGNCPMSPRQRLASLVHELAHLRHGDDVVAFLAEVWRALAWFYPPVHFTVSQLRREREYRCDDLAAAKLETPEQYAEWLLDLAPVRVGPPAPLLAASLLGGASLADRVRRIARGELRWSGPLGRRTRAILALAALLMLGAAGSVRLVGFAGRAAAGEPADAPLPEIAPAQLAAKIREAMGRYDDKGSFRVVFTETRDTNWRFSTNVGTPDLQRPILVSFRGRARHDSDGTRWRAEYDSMIPTALSTRLSPDRWSTGFDGTRHYDWQISRNQFILGEPSPFVRQWAPRTVIWERSEELIQMLEKPHPGRFSIAIGQRVIEGMSCYVVESKSRDGQWGGETSVSPRQGYLPIARKWTRLGKVYSSRSLQGVHEVVPGIWAPERIEEETNAVHDDGASRLSSRRRIQVVEYRPRQVPPASTFQFELPYGVDVVDRPQGWAYHNDPWWPEVGAMLHEKFGWPKPDFSPLRNLGSASGTMFGTASGRKLEGQPAPPLRVANWVNSKPIDLAALRGKVVLIEFGSVGDLYHAQFGAALRALYAAYHPAGLEILSIHPPTEDVETIRRFARDYRLPYPVALDEGRPGTVGATAEAFGLRGQFISAVLIDREGKMHAADKPNFAGGRFIDVVVSILRQGGPSEVKPVSLDLPRLPRAASQAADLLFRTEVKRALEANPSGKITGRIVDADRRPIAGANVRATLQFTMLEMTQPGIYFNIAYGAPDERFQATSGSDGRFELAGLCKGAYVVKVEAPGRAWAERKVFIAPDHPSASAEFVLDQGDSISGEVRDTRGKPIAGATVTSNQRQHFENGELRFTAGVNIDGVRTDAAGRFRLAGLQEGRYILEVTAPGFQKRVLEPIPAGDGDVAVTLERSP